MQKLIYLFSPYLHAQNQKPATTISLEKGFVYYNNLTVKQILFSECVAVTC